MLLRPNWSDARRIAFALGRVILVVGAAGLLPLAWAIGKREWASAVAFVLMIGIAALIGSVSTLVAPKDPRLRWSHGMTVVALAWLAVPALGALPLYLSGHYGSMVDAFFDAMSGVSTTGLSVIQDLDHLSESVNIWRHALQFLGGQGIVLAALTFFAATGILSLYYGEGRDERIFPSVMSTARFIWLVSGVHAAVGVTVYTLEGVFRLGYSWSRALFHGANVFMAAFDTGGFTPQSTSLMYYHSLTFEVTTAVLMIAGAISFSLHHMWWRKREGSFKNLEVRTILITFGITLTLGLVGLAAQGLYNDVGSLTRRGFFQVLSAHTGTGFATVSSSDLADWQGLAFVGMAMAMALGGMASSTAGGVKSLRVGLTVRAIFDSVRGALLPEKAVVPRTYRQNGQRHLTPQLAQSVMVISLLYVGLYLAGAAVGVAYGYPLQDALFESVSASAAVGLSVGITSPTMPVLMKILMIGQMWLGRLEFIAAFSLVGFVASWVVGE